MVIVFGVMASFFAEDWRQALNAKNSTQVLVEKAKIEAKYFIISEDSSSSLFRAKVNSALKKTIKGKRLSNDSLMFLFEMLDIDDLRQGVPTLILLIYSELGKDLEDYNTIDAIVSMKFQFDMLKTIYEGNDKYVHQLEPFFQKYNVIDDLIIYEEKMQQNSLAAIKIDGYDRFKDLDKIKASKGNYDALLADQEFLGILKEVHRWHIFQEIYIHTLKLRMKQLIDGHI